MKLSSNAKLVLEQRYLLRNEKGECVETPEELIRRVARAAAQVEGKDRKKWEERFFELMVSLRFLPNSPTLMNAGKPEGQLSACFVLPVEDSLDGIFDTLKNAAKIHQSGGGTGFGFSRLRPAGSKVRSTQGVASGPVSFIRIFDTATETIKQGGARRGANMAVLRVDHPDIESFIDSKRDQRSITNFNISVGVTDAFMRAVSTGGSFDLRDPFTGKAAQRVDAAQLFRRLAQSAWECGDPGIVFLDRVNFFNPTPRLGQMESTNPCGEQPLLAYESCNLGSLNVAAYVRGRHFRWEEFAEDVALSVRFLDNVVDANHFPVAQSRRITRRNRKIGLGVMGFADALLLMGLRYSSAEAQAFGEKLMAVLDRCAKAESCRLAGIRGPFANWKGSLWERLGYPPMRNATVSTVAPTGTISLIAGVSSGIEPIFAGVFHRNVLSGARLQEVHPAVARLLKSQSLQESELSARLGPAWEPAYQVSLEGHLRMQAAFQRHSDSAVSKTINLPQSASVAEVEHAYGRAYELGCKGITVYRDQSRATQVLEAQSALGSPEAGGAGGCEDCDA